jgi:hypothetical protein
MIKMEKILNLVVVDHSEPFKPMACVHSFAYRDDILQPDKALRAAVGEFVTSGTDESEAALKFANGFYNWADAMSTVPNALFEKRGLSRIYQDTVDITVDHDEVLCGGSAEASGAEIDTFSIYQLKHGEDLRYIRFIGYEQLVAGGGKPEGKNYCHVYTDALSDGMTLDDIYRIFNLNRPADFRGHSLSISDVIVLRKNGVASAYYVDSPAGYRELPGFQFSLMDGASEPVYPEDNL